MSEIPFMDGTPDEGLNFTSGEISREFAAQVSAEAAAAITSAIYGAAPPASFPPPGDPIADLKRWAAEISALPEPIAYIVLDHDQPAGGYEERRDARGKRYVLASPSFLDGATHRKFGEISVVGSTLWRDIDSRSSYDTLPDGSYPIPDDYQGPVSMRPRIVVVEGIDHDGRGYVALVRNEHNGRPSRIKVSGFRKTATQGFELLP